MAIYLEYHNVIVPVQAIRDKLGEDVYQRTYAASALVVWTEWTDGYLFREGCMNGSDLSDLLDKWEGRGFKLLTTMNGEKHWKDVCVVNSGHGPSYPCAWIDYDAEKNIVWLTGQAPGEIVGLNK